jgi:hypothetical protein
MLFRFYGIIISLYLEYAKLLTLVKIQNAAVEEYSTIERFLREVLPNYIDSTEMGT